MTLMFQLEVAERITAAPATSAYGRLAVLAQWRCRCDLLLRLPPGAFSPPPKVWSAVVGFTPHAEDPPPALFAAMEKLTAAAFGQRRKMLRGALKTLGNAEALLDEAGIAGDRRGETLTVTEFDRLARALASRG
jgi:16S rRNA (adenine1518-N6/adenine1519-N6)-dimethyltransferase